MLAPEHPLVPGITAAGGAPRWRRTCARRRRESEIDRLNAERGKTGVFTGAYAVNPVNGEKIPVWIADYVLMGYGTGAIMCVPGHDERDFAFARKFGLPVVQVVSRDGSTYDLDGGRSRGGHRRQLRPRGAAWPRPNSSRPSAAGWRKRASAARRSTTACATG